MQGRAQGKSTEVSKKILKEGYIGTLFKVEQQFPGTPPTEWYFTNLDDCVDWYWELIDVYGYETDYEITSRDYHRFEFEDGTIILWDIEE